MTGIRVSLIGVLLFVGCATAPVARMPFPAEEYARLDSTGVAVVKGQAFLKTRGGEVITAAGNEVILNPETSYSQQWFEVSYLGGKELAEPDPRVLPYVAKTTADADGRFTFQNVAPGNYYVVTSVVWEAPGGNILGGPNAQGGYVAKLITVREGDHLDVVVTR